MSTQNWSTHRPLTLGFMALALLVLGLGTWSIKVNIAGAIIASGLVEVEINRQVVQHPNGGVIGEILVDDGDVVALGDILMRFDDTLLRSDLSVTTGQLYEITARKARLKAERDGVETLIFPSDLLEAANAPFVKELIDGQADLFAARRDSLAREAALLREKTAQINEQITGKFAQITAAQTQKTLLNEELVDELALLEKGLSQATKVRGLQREAARVGGLLGDLTANIAQNRGRIAEIEIEILRLQTRLREDAITTLRDLQFREIELNEKRITLLETLQRMDIRAPASGVIYGKKFHALRAVVRPAEPILYIVPQDTALIITARIPAVHIDQVHQGQAANLRFSAFDMRTTPEIPGHVVRVSADIFTDEFTGETYYSADISPNAEGFEMLKDLEVIPGMPVQAFIKTTDRTPLNYLIKPLMDYFTKAFREG
ncbi:MAG: HlyD family type I secretion periplasmic adaptor subunit [Paracoccaceae bacterium]